MKHTLNIIILFLLCGCSFIATEKTLEEKAIDANEIKLIHDTALVPVYVLVRESCAYHMKNGVWPEPTNKLTAGSFDHLKVVSSTKESLKLNIKVNSVNGDADLTINNSPLNPESRPYSFNLFSSFPGGDLKVKSAFSCSGSGLNADQLMVYSKQLTSLLSSYNSIAKISKSNQDKSSTQKGIEFGTKVALCLLLKLDSSSCK
ncbi:MAG: hypothetical protein ACMZ64_06730 [Oleiphilus sp.]